jgi:hypothetical protein
MHRDRDSIWPPWWFIATAVAVPTAFLLCVTLALDGVLKMLAACTLGVVASRPFGRLRKWR